MGVQQDIDNALFDAVDAMFQSEPKLAGIPYAWDNRKIDPPNSGRYVDITVFRNNQQNYAWAKGTVYPGILQLSLVDQPDAGTNTALELCDVIVSHFPKGRIMRKGTTQVKIEVEPEILSAVQDRHKVEFPVSVRYRCFA